MLNNMQATPIFAVFTFQGTMRLSQIVYIWNTIKKPANTLFCPCLILTLFVMFLWHFWVTSGFSVMRVCTVAHISNIPKTQRKRSGLLLFSNTLLDKLFVGLRTLLKIVPTEGFWSDSFVEMNPLCYRK